MNNLLYAIIGHLVGDYLLQNDWMALNKKRTDSWIGDAACTVHSFIWMASVCLFAGWFSSDSWAPFVLFVTHYIQDRSNIVVWWMTKVNRQEKFLKGPCAPWSAIVVDNVWHIVTLYFVSIYCL